MKDKHNYISPLTEIRPWNGLLSKEMIASIFWHDNPVHDGAAIIREDRITEVGVILPLSYRNDLPSHYGTRHRAALGLVEVTDALIIVVSEETGNVVAAKDSNIIDIGTNDELIKILKVSPSVVEATLEVIIKKALPLQVDWVGNRRQSNFGKHLHHLYGQDTA